MKRAYGIVAAAVAGTMLAAAAPASWAESGVGETDVPALFAPFTNAKAKGETLSGFLTFAMYLEEGTEECSLNVKNMVVVTALEGAKKIASFHRDFNRGGSTPTAPFCMDRVDLQADFIFGLFKEEVVPFFFGPCAPGATCPPFEVTSVTEFLQSGNGGFSMKFTMAVDTKVASGQ